jgi:cyclohexanecarboxylate-CoA ligase
VGAIVAETIHALTPAHQRLWDYAVANAGEQGDRIAVVISPERISFAQLIAEAEALAAGLEHMGIRPGDTVSYQLPNCREALILVLAIGRLGAVANPIVPIFRQREVRFILDQTKSKLIVVPSGHRRFDYFAMAREVIGDSPIAILTCFDRVDGVPFFCDLISEYRNQYPSVDLPDPDADAFLIYTSGTVGSPKGVRHSQRTLVTEAESLRQVNGLTRSDIGLLPSPLTHITGILYGNFLPQVSGGRLCLMDLWEPVEAAKIIERERCTWLIGATPFLQGIVYDSDARKHDLSSLRLVRCGGADVPPKLIRDAYALGLTAVRSYGSTEFPGVSGVADQTPEKSATTDGKVHDHIDIRIVDHADGRTVLPIGEVGEIQTRGPEAFLGYKDASLDADVWTDDGWVRSGDLGFIDLDRYVTIVGRLKDIIIRKGENISAKEVEDALSEHPAIANVAVIGLKDVERGEMVVAVCTLNTGFDFSIDAMRAHLDRCGMARQKFPERLEILEALPTTAAGKIRKVELREMFARKDAGAD